MYKELQFYKMEAIVDTCNLGYFRKWSVEYLDQTEYSGQMEISQMGGGIVVVGMILKNGKLDGSYSSTDAICPNAEREMVFTYRLATGHTGQLTLNLATVTISTIFIDGKYIDNGAGDTGRVRLRPI
jgi:hypothetical protein